MILNFNTFITEAFTKEVGSIEKFLKGIEQGADDFLLGVKNVCTKYDIPMSKLTGKYVVSRKALDMVDKSSAVFWFNINKYLYKTVGKLTHGQLDSISKESDFALVIDIPSQETGYNKLRQNRHTSKEGSSIDMDNSDWINKNRNRYRKILRERRRPENTDRIFSELIAYAIRNHKDPMDVLYDVRYDMDKAMFDSLLRMFLNSGFSDRKYGYAYNGY